VTQMLRVEEWQHEFQPEPLEPVLTAEGETVDRSDVSRPSMINTIVVLVWEGEVVHVQQEMAPELRLDTSKAKEIVPEFQHRFVWEFPYEVVKEALIEAGWSYVSSSEN
jgi:hypothetical protein